MYIQIVSDLHLETHPRYLHWTFPQTSNYLTLLGLIGHVQDSRLLAFLEKQLKRYFILFLLPRQSCTISRANFGSKEESARICGSNGEIAREVYLGSICVPRPHEV